MTDLRAGEPISRGRTPIIWTRGAVRMLAGALVVAVACTSEQAPEVAVATRSPLPSSSAPSPGPPGRFDARSLRLTLEPVVDGLDAPIAAVNAGDETGRLYVAEQRGVIRIIEDGRLLDEPFLDISDRVRSGGEQGLLGLAFHPRSSSRLLVNYTDDGGNTVISEFRRAGASSADPGSERVLLNIDQPFANHNGGGLAFAPSGHLFIGTGDGGSGGDPQNNGQRTDTLLGKMLRIDVDAASAGDYAIPSDNPFVDAPGVRPEIWATGLRNPWRFSFDRDTERLWIADVGQNELEEINRAPVRAGGINYGWNLMEGRRCFQDGCDPSGTQLPIAQYGHEAGCSVTGGYVYRGTQHSSLAGAYLFGDFCSGTIWALDAEGPSDQKPVIVAETDLSISSFGEDERGELYVVDLQGRLLMIGVEGR